MAITKIGSPDSNINPAYNPLVYYFDSDNNTEDAFRYVVEVFKAGTTDKIFEKTIIPDFDDGKCVCNLNREMSDFLSYHLDFDELDGDNYRATDAYYRFYLDIGEEYIEEWQWDDFGFAGSVNWANHGDPQYNPNGLWPTMLYTTDALNQPPYTSGDTIFVDLNVGTQDRPSISGVHKVLDVYQQSSGGVEWVVVLEIPWVGSGTSSGGSARYSDFRKSRFTNLLSVNNECVINTAFSKIDFLNYDSADYNMITTGAQKFLTQAFNNYKVRESNTMLLQYMSFKDNTIGTPRKALFENDSGDSSVLTLTTGVDVGVWGIDASPIRTNWGTVQSGTLPIVKPSTDTYSITLLNINDNPVSETKTINIDRGCVNKGSIEMLFMDKLGSFLPWNFTFRNVQDQQVEKSNYSKYLGGYESTGESTGKFTYDLKDGGRETYNEEYKKNYLLRTSWLADKESEFFPNVIHSPVTMIKVGGVFQRCTITTSSFEVKDDNWNTLKRYEINVKLSNDEIINI